MTTLLNFAVEESSTSHGNGNGHGCSNMDAFFTLVRECDSSRFTVY
jgi:hypothetical protein